MCIYVYRMYIFVSCVLNKFAVVSSLWSLKTCNRLDIYIYVCIVLVSMEYAFGRVLNPLGSCRI